MSGEVEELSRGGLDVVAIGETLALLTAEQIGRPDVSTRWRTSVGGAESNVLVGLRRLGAAVAWLSRVGDDDLGRIVLERLRGEGIDVSQVVVEAAAGTGLMLKWRRTSELTQVQYFRGASAARNLTAADLPSGLVESARVLHLTGITAALGDGPAELLHEAIERAREASTIVCFDLNHRPALWGSRAAQPELLPLAARAHVVAGSVAELAILYPGLEQPEALAEQLVADGAEWGVVKLGAAGALAAHDGRLIRAKAPSVDCVDEVGAGDAFAAGLIWSLLEDLPPEQCLATAVASGSFACSVPGDCDGLPTTAELAELHAVEAVRR
jgi:2-dehydro-3-deoxygluconokinase